MAVISSEYLPKFYPNQILDGGVIYEIESAPTHGVVIPQELAGRNTTVPLLRFSGNTSAVYLPLLSDHLKEKLCRRVGSQWIQDKTVLSAHNSITDRSLRNQKLHFNISYLHINAASLGHNQSEIYMQRGEALVLQPKHINALKLYDSLSLCNNSARGGFIVEKAPQFGKISGLDRFGIVWWEDVISGNFLYKHNENYRVSDDMTLSVILEQNGRRHVITDSPIELILHVLPDHIEQDLLTESRNLLTQTVKLLQGKSNVTFTINSTVPSNFYTLSQQPRYGRIVNNKEDVITNFYSMEALTYEQVEMTPGDS